MNVERRYLKFDSHWNFGIEYNINDFVSLSAQQLHGSTFSITAKVHANPKNPPFGPGLELAPVPMRNKTINYSQSTITDVQTLRRVLEYDKFDILKIEIDRNNIRIDLINRKFRSISQALGRVSSAVQRFSNKQIETAEVVFHNKDFQISSFEINLKKVQDEQFSPQQFNAEYPSIQIQNKTKINYIEKTSNPFTWGIGPYITHRLFNPDLPLSAELGAEFSFDLELFEKTSLEGSLRKSILTDLTDNSAGQTLACQGCIQTGHSMIWLAKTDIFMTLQSLTQIRLILQYILEHILDF